MKIIVLGGDGYLGWATSMRLASHGHEVVAVDNYLRRHLARTTRSEPLFPNPNLHDRAELFEKKSGHRIEVAIGDCTDYRFVSDLFGKIKPDAVVHYAEQPSAPYSMIG